MAICKNCGTIQKIPNLTWIKDIKTIYRNYDLYYQSGGLEQVIFDKQGKSFSRSEKILQKIKKNKYKDILDFGCGNGNTLEILSKLFPKASLYGADISEKNKERLKKIKNFKKLFLVSKEKINKTFDLITAFHSIEHVPDPMFSISQLLEVLKLQGCLFIQVPDIAQNPYDLLVADHRTHFSKNSIARILIDIGLKNFKIYNNLVPKELSILIYKKFPVPIKRQVVTHEKIGPYESKRLVTNHLKKLSAQIIEAKKIRKITKLFGIFGASIAGIWLNNSLKKQGSDFFVDEDPKKFGRFVNGKPVFSPQSLQKTSLVYVPLVSKIAKEVVRKNRKLATFLADRL